MAFVWGKRGILLGFRGVFLFLLRVCLWHFLEENRGSIWVSMFFLCVFFGGFVYGVCRISLWFFLGVL